MSVNYGGKQKVLRDTVMTAGCSGPHDTKIHLNGGAWSAQCISGVATETVNLKPGAWRDAEHVFHRGLPLPLCYNLTLTEGGFANQAKGMWWVLWERGWCGEMMST